MSEKYSAEFKYNIFVWETCPRILLLERFLLRFSQTLSLRRGKRYRFLGNRDRLGASWHSICFPIITSIFVHNWVRKKNTYACNYCNHRQKIIANQYPFRETWKKTLQSEMPREKEEVSLLAQAVNWLVYYEVQNINILHFKETIKMSSSASLNNSPTFNITL